MHLSQIAQEHNPLRPQFSESVMNNVEYVDLAQKCWSYKPSDRPTFDEIVPQLLVIQEFAHII